MEPPPWRRLVMLWASTGVLLGALQGFVVAASVHSPVNDIRLGVNIRNKDILERAPSCLHSISRVELLNQQNTDILIHGIHVSSEETVRVIRKDNVRDHHSSFATSIELEDELPQQMHVTRFPALSLGPGQVAIVPLTFLPRFPPNPSETMGGNEKASPTASPSWPSFSPDGEHSLSIWQQADREEWLFVSGESSQHQTNVRHGIGGINIRSNHGYHAETLSTTGDDAGGGAGGSSSSAEEYRISSILLVETNQGNAQIPIHASSYRGNPFALPDTIYFNVSAALRTDENGFSDLFRSPESESSSYVSENGIRIVDRFLHHATPSMNGGSALGLQENSITENAAGRYYPDCYDLYIMHPHSNDMKDMRVFEVMISDPGKMCLKVDPNKDPSIPLTGTDKQHVIREWVAVDEDPDGALNIPSDNQQHYLVTICTTDTGVPHDKAADDYLDGKLQWLYPDSDNRSLGFLQIRTDGETLFVGLEKAGAMPSTAPFSSANGQPVRLMSPSKLAAPSTSGAATSSRIVLNSGGTASNVLPLESLGPSSLFAGTDLGRATATASSVMTDSNETDAAMDAGSNTTTLIDLGLEPEPHGFLRALTDHLDLYLLPPMTQSNEGIPEWPTSVQTTTGIIGINNTAEESISLIYATIAVHRDHADKFDSYGLELGISTTDAQDHCARIGPSQTCEKAFTVTASVDLGKLKDVGLTSFELNGTVLVQGSANYVSTEEWRQAMSENISLDSDIVLEIPFSIHFIDGGVGIILQETSHPLPHFFHVARHQSVAEIVTAAFFPSTPMGLSAGINAVFPEKPESTMEHQLRFFRTFEVDGMIIEHAQVINDQVNGTRSQLDESLCSRFGVSWSANLSGHRSNDVVALGVVNLTYTVPFAEEAASNMENRTTEIYPTECALEVTTMPPTGTHRFPLIVYSGRVQLSANEFTSEVYRDTWGSPSGDADKGAWHQSIFGFAKLLDWFQTSKTGSALRSIIDAGTRKRERDDSLLAKYLSGLTRRDSVLEIPRLRPILLKVGAVAPDETEIIPLYITNYNPVPTVVTIDVGEVEGMSITLGRDPAGGRGDGTGLLDQIPKKPFQRVFRNRHVVDPRLKSGPFAMHPVNGLRKFLLSSDVATSFLSYFPFRDSVWMSDAAIHKFPFLKRLYSSNAYAEFHKSESPTHPPSKSSPCERAEHPPTYRQFARRHDGQKISGPVILAINGKSFSQLAICWDKEMALNDEGAMSGVEVAVPPGGVVRFDVSLRSPPSEVLERDITQFLSTGLSLSTSHGEIMPVLVTFDTPHGKLDISPFLGHPGAETGSVHGTRAIRVPAGLFGNPAPAGNTSLSIPPKARSLDDLSGVNVIPSDLNTSEGGVSLFMTSSFNRDIELLKVSSCNPWFEVVLNNQTSPLISDPVLGVNIGSVNSVVSCSDNLKNGSTATPKFPSFFRCVLNWMAERVDLQPQGCGSRLSSEAHPEDSEGKKRLERSDISNAMHAFNRALHISAWSLGNTMGNTDSQRKFDGILPPVLVDAVAAAWDIWRASSNSSIRRLSTNLRAVIKYNTSVDGTPGAQVSRGRGQERVSQYLSVAMRNLTIEAALETPRLLDVERANVSAPTNDDEPPTVEFPRTPVATVSTLMLPLRNPTAVPVRVRLAVLPDDENGYDFDPEFVVDSAVKSQFIKDLQTPYVQNGLKAHSNYDAVRQEWWDGSGSYFLRDFNGDLIRSHYNVTVRAGSGAVVSLLNPSLLSNTAFLAGCGTRCGIRDEVPKVDVFYDLRQSSPIGASSAGGTMLLGRHRAESADSNRALPNAKDLGVLAGGALLSAGYGPTPFALPHSALGEVVIPPYGEAELGPIFFRPPGRTKYIGCDQVDRIVSPPHCRNQDFSGLVFLENSLTGLERVALKGKALWERVEFFDPPSFSPSDDMFSDIETRNGRPALIFPGTATKEEHGASSVVKEITIKNTGDVTVGFDRVYFSDTNKLHKKTAPLKSSCTSGDFALLNCSVAKGAFEPFSLRPGESLSIFIAHRPRCGKLSDFVALNFQYVRAKSGHIYRGSSRAERLLSAAMSWKKTFRKPKEVILVGYDMTRRDMASCVPSSQNVRLKWSKDFPLSARSSHGNSTEFHTNGTDKSGTSLLDSLFYLVTCCLALGGAGVCFLLVLKSFRLRQISAPAFHNKIVTVIRRNEQSSSDANWRAAFRCLARSDPTSGDLQIHGREQVRMLVVTRFRAMGVLAPQCFNTRGEMQRERAIVPHSGGRLATGKEGSVASSEKSRTVREAIFRRFRSGDPPMLPCDLGWRTAVAKGLIDDASLRMSPITLKTEALLKRRKEQYVAVENITISDEADDEAVSVGGTRESESSPFPSYDDESDSQSSVDHSLAETFQNRRNGQVSTAARESPSVQAHRVNVPEISHVGVGSDNPHYTKVTSKANKTSRKQPGPRTPSSVEKNNPSTDQNLTSKSDIAVDEHVLPAKSKTSRNKASKSKDKSVNAAKDSGRASGKDRSSNGNARGSKMKISSDALARSKKSPGATETFERPKPSDSQKSPKPAARPLRPPPGLAPPPGFSASPIMSPAKAPPSPIMRPSTSSDELAPFTVASVADQVIVTVAAPSLIKSSTAIAGDDLRLPSPVSPIASSLVGQSVDHAPLLESLFGESPRPMTPCRDETTADFDVLDFLDGILNEPSASNAADGNEAGLLSEVPVAEVDNPADIVNPSPVAIPSNPWASVENQSRALAYGISFEEQQVGSELIAESEPVGGFLPLLTPAAILAQQSDDEGDDEEGKEVEKGQDKKFEHEGSSFYANLFGE